MPLRINSDLPDLSGATNWYNGQVSAGDLKSHPTLVHFWSVSCGICSEQMPQVRAWRETYQDKGLKMVAIHMPRSEKDTELPQVEQAIRDYGLTWPVAVDNTHAIVEAFDNKYVPAFYVFDADGHLRLFQAGEKTGMVEKTLDRVVNRTAEEAPS